MHDIRKFAAFKLTIDRLVFMQKGNMEDRIPFSKISFSETSRMSALECLDAFFAGDGKPSYIGVLNVFMAMSANRDMPELQSYYKQAFLTIPDGMPLVWYGRALGYEKVSRTCGPELLVDLLGISGEKNYSHYFIGSTPDTLERMKKEIAGRFPGARVLGAESPPFRALSDDEVQVMADTVNRLKPSFVWIGMSAPKQEFLIQRLLPLINSHTIFAGVGLAFSYLAGDVHAAPPLIQKIGLEWVWRCIQQPAKMKPKTMWRLLSFIPVLLRAKLYKKPMR